MKRASIFFLVCCTLLLPATDALAQTRRRTTTSRPSARTARTPRTAAPDAQAGASRVAEQIKNLTRFLYLLGGVERSIETVDEAARHREASPAVIEQNEKSKATVKNSLRNVREGLDELEIDFRTKPELQRYYIRLAGVAAGAATAEEQAAANQFDRAGRSLLQVVNRLTDVLLEMR